MTDERTRGGHVVEWLDAWRTDELDAPRARAVEEHLAGCAGCRAELAELEAFATTVEGGYRAVEAARAEPDWGANRAAIVARTSGRRSSRASWIVRWAPQVAVVLIAVVAIGVLVEQGVRGPEDVERALRGPAETATVPASPDSPTSTAAEAGRPEAAADVAAGAGVVEESEAARADDAPEGGANAVAEEPAAEPEALADPPPPAADERDSGERFRGEAEEAEQPREADRDREADEAAPAAPDVADGAALEQKAVPAPPARFESRARAALAARDTTAARAALGFWADSVESTALPAAERERLRALAESLADWLAGTP